MTRRSAARSAREESQGSQGNQPSSARSTRSARSARGEKQGEEEPAHNFMIPYLPQAPVSPGTNDAEMLAFLNSPTRGIQLQSPDARGRVSAEKLVSGGADTAFGSSGLPGMDRSAPRINTGGGGAPPPLFSPPQPSPSADLELELTLRGNLIVDQQRRIVELEGELAMARNELEKARKAGFKGAPLTLAAGATEIASPGIKIEPPLGSPGRKEQQQQQQQQQQNERQQPTQEPTQQPMPIIGEAEPSVDDAGKETAGSGTPGKGKGKAVGDGSALGAVPSPSAEAVVGSATGGGGGEVAGNNAEGAIGGSTNSVASTVSSLAPGTAPGIATLSSPSVLSQLATGMAGFSSGTGGFGFALTSPPGSSSSLLGGPGSFSALVGGSSIFGGPPSLPPSAPPSAKKATPASAKKPKKKEKEEKPPKQDGQSRYWTADEHQRFLEGIEKYGAKQVKEIAAYVATRTATQVRTHAQKYYLRLTKQKAEEAKARMEANDPTLKVVPSPAQKPAGESQGEAGSSVGKRGRRGSISSDMAAALESAAEGSKARGEKEGTGGGNATSSSAASSSAAVNASTSSSSSSSSASSVSGSSAGVAAAKPNKEEKERIKQEKKEAREKEKAERKAAKAAGAVVRKPAGQGGPGRPPKRKAGDAAAAGEPSTPSGSAKRARTSPPPPTIHAGDWTEEEFVLLEKGLHAYAGVGDIRKVYKHIAETYTTKRTADEVERMHAAYQAREMREKGSAVTATGAPAKAPKVKKSTASSSASSSSSSASSSSSSAIGSPSQGNNNSNGAAGGGVPHHPVTPGAGFTLPLDIGQMSPTYRKSLTPLNSPGSPSALSPSFLHSLSPSRSGEEGPAQGKGGKRGRGGGLFIGEEVEEPRSARSTRSRG